MHKEFSFKTKDNFQLEGFVWEHNTTKKATLVICHGMAEHILRYDEFASFLALQGYVVVGYDQRGHGRTLKNPEDIGYMSDDDHFMQLVNDLSEIVNYSKSLNDKLPIFILGHSMGSFVLERVLTLNKVQIDGAIISGSNLNKGLKYFFGKKIIKMIVKKNGRRYRSKFVNNLSIGSFNKKFKPANTNVDWLSSDPKVCQAYVDDELCGAIFPASYYMDLINGFKAINNNLNNISKSLPILIFSGEDDPVGLFGKGIKKLYDRLLNIGVKDLTFTLYPNGRHEMLNEVNKITVYNDVFEWLNSRINK